MGGGVKNLIIQNGSYKDRVGVKQGDQKDRASLKRRGVIKSAEHTQTLVNIWLHYFIHNFFESTHVWGGGGGGSGIFIYEFDLTFFMKY